MKKNKLTKKIFISIFVVVIASMFAGIANAGQENIILDSNDVTTANWIGLNGEVVNNGDNSQTITQAVEKTSYFAQYFTNNTCAVHNESMVMRVKVKPEIDGDLSWFIMSKASDGAGGTVNSSAIRYKEVGLDWNYMTVPFLMSHGDGYWQTFLTVQDQQALAKTTMAWADLQVARNPGTTLYSAGDSICASVFNGASLVNHTTYTQYFEYAKNIIAVNDGNSGDNLSEIYTRMTETDGDTIPSLAEQKYPLVMIEGGINDIYNDNTPVSEMQSTMTNMINYAKTRSDHVVVMNIPPTSSTNETAKDRHVEYNTWLASQESTLGFQLFDVVSLLGSGEGTHGLALNSDYYFGTNIHPNVIGHKAIADALASQVNMPNTSLYISDNVTTGGTCVRDESAPSITLNSPTGNLPDGTTETTLSLTTDEEAICRYSTSSGVDYDSMTETFEETGETAQSQLVTGLVNGNTYNYYVKCRDRATNENAEDLEINFSVTGEVTNNAPTDISLSNNSIDENQPSFTTIGTLSTTDANSGDSHTYSLNCSTPGVDDSYFNISGEELRNTEVFDYETPIDDNSDNNYEICVRTNDGTDTFDKNFTVAVNDTSDTLGENIAVGFQALLSNLGNGNIGIGNFSGQYVGIAGIDSNILGNSSIFIGENTRPLADDQTNQIVIGTDAIGLGSDSVVLGNDDIATTALKGNVGIGTTDPKTELEVDGVIRAVPASSRVCDSDSEGGIFYDSDDKHFYGCDGLEWVKLDN